MKTSDLTYLTGTMTADEASFYSAPGWYWRIVYKPGSRIARTIWQGPHKEAKGARSAAKRHTKGVTSQSVSHIEMCERS